MPMSETSTEIVKALPGIMGAILGGASTIIGLILRFRIRQQRRKIEELHILVNSRLDELLAATKTASKAEGAEQERARADAAKISAPEP